MMTLTDMSPFDKLLLLPQKKKKKKKEEEKRKEKRKKEKKETYMKNFTSGVARLCRKTERVFCQTARITVASESACVLNSICVLNADGVNLGP